MRRRRFLLVSLALLAGLALAFIALSAWVLPCRLFRKAVLSPMPSSVKKIWGSGYFDSNDCHTYVLRFAISERDLQLILASDRFRELEYVEYNEGILAYAEAKRPFYDAKDRSTGLQTDMETSFMLFNRWPGWFKPRWFQFNRWQTFKAYAVTREDDIVLHSRLLLYNADLGEAYFVDFRTWKHGW